MDEIVAAKELLQAVGKAVKATEKLTEMAVALLNALKSKEVREEKNTLARRARIER